MKNPKTSISADHIGDIRFLYLEEMIDQEAKVKVEDHLLTCSDCRSEIQELRNLMTILRENKEMLCPEPWELFDYARGAEHKLALNHISQCPNCQRQLEEFKEKSEDSLIPDQIWNEVKKSIGPTVKPKNGFLNWISLLKEKLSNFFTPPVLGLASAVAIALFVVILYDFQTPVMIGLSKEKWLMPEMRLMAPEAKPRRLVASREPMTIVIVFKNFRETVPQEQIDELYRALNPPQKIRDEFTIVSPAEIQKAVNEKRLEASNQEKFLKGLYEVFKVKKAIIVTVDEIKNYFDFQIKIVDSSTGNVLSETEEKQVTSEKLASKIREKLFSLLGQS